MKLGPQWNGFYYTEWAGWALFHFNVFLTPPLAAEKGIQKQRSCEWCRIKRKLSKNVSAAQEIETMCIFMPHLLQQIFCENTSLQIICGYFVDLNQKQERNVSQVKGKWQKGGEGKCLFSEKQKKGNIFSQFKLSVLHKRNITLSSKEPPTLNNLFSCLSATAKSC